MSTKQKLDRYTVLRKLATGGMGEVFMARQEGIAGFEKTVVIKTLRPEFADHTLFREMFFEEARVAAMARHGNVMSVLDVGMDGETCFIVMEYIDGWTVRQVLQARESTRESGAANASPEPAVENKAPPERRGALPLPFVLSIAIDAADGLAHIHDLHDSAGRPLSLVHRDVSPENIMVATDGRSKLVDFGIAKRRDSPIETAPGVLKGKARYLSPEQVRGAAITPASDQFALGSVLFEMAIGEPLFPGDSTPQIMYAMGSGEIRDPGEVAGDLPPSFCAVVRRTLDKEPGERYASCAELAVALRQLQDSCGAIASHGELSVWLHQRVPRDDRGGRAGAGPGTDPTEMSTSSKSARTRSDSPAASNQTMAAAATIAHASRDITTRTAPGTERTEFGDLAVELIGRSRELEELRARFAEGSRVITVLGPGGIGKSSLARRHAYLARFEQDRREVTIADLTNAHSDDDVLYQVAAPLSLELRSVVARDEAVSRIGLALAGRGPTLVVLDNVERVLDPIAHAITTWLPVAPQTRFLVTSREPLSLSGEKRLDLDPLTRDDAIELLCHRIQAVRSRWRPSASDRDTAGEIVDRLDRLPLAIELAAGRGAVLSIGQLHRRLTRGLDWLRSKRRDLSGRHASLAATIAWSWQLLDRWERSALAQCTVFRGSFTLLDAEAIVDLDDPAVVETLGSAPALDSEPEIATAVTGRDEHDFGDVIDAVQSLREKSLLTGDSTGASAGDDLRFRMYESIRSFVEQNLDPTARARVKERHLAHFLDIAEELGGGIDGPEGTECLDRMATSLDNLCVALDSAKRAGSRDVCRLVLAVEPLLAARGPAPLHLGWLDAGLAAADRMAENAAPARLLCARGTARVMSGDHGGAKSDLAAAIEQAESLGDSCLIALANEAMGFHHLRRRQLDRAWPHCERAYDLYRTTGDRDAQARILGKIALYHQRSGDTDRASESFDRAIALHERQKNLWAAGQLYGRRGLLRLESGRLAEAREDLQRALRSSRQWGDLTRESADTCNLGLLEMEAGNRDEARRYLQQALHIDVRQGNRPSQSIAHINLGVVALDSGDLDTADECFHQALAIAREVEYPHLELMALGNLGITAQARGDLDGALAHLTSCESMRPQHPETWPQPTVFLAHLAAVHAERGDLAAADREFAAASERARCGQHESHLPVIECLEGFGDLARHRMASHESRADDEAGAHRDPIARARARLTADHTSSCDLRIARAMLARAISPYPPTTHPGK